MKKLLFIISLFICIASSAQIPGYTIVNSRYKWLSVGTEAFNLPAMGTPALQTSQWVRSGALVYDSTGGNQGVHYWTGAAWVRLADTLDIGNVVGASNGDTLVSGNIELGSRLTRDTRIDLNSQLFYYAHTSASGANSLTINLDDNDGQVVLDNSGGALLETGFKYIGYDHGMVKNRIQNLYASTSNGAAVGEDFIDAWGHATQIYQGTPYNAFTSGGLMLRYTGNSMKLHVDSAGGFIGFNVGSVGGMTTNEQMRVMQAGIGIGTAVPTHKLTVNGQVRITAIDNASVFDTVLVINDGVVQARLASTLIGVNLFNSNGSLTSTRSVELNGFDLTIQGNVSGADINLLTGDGSETKLILTSGSGFQLMAQGGQGIDMDHDAAGFTFTDGSGVYKFENLVSTIDTTTYKFVVADASGNIRRSNSVAQFGGGGGSAALTATYVGYGDGNLTGEAAFNYVAGTNTLTVDNITTAGAGSTIAIAPASGSAIFSMKSSAGAFTTTWTYDASRNFITDYRDGNTIRVNGNNIAAFNSTGFAVNGGGGTAADFTVRSTSFNPFVVVDVSADKMGIGVATTGLTHTFVVNGDVRFSTTAAGSAADSILVTNEGVINRVAPADFTGLPYVSSTATGEGITVGASSVDLGGTVTTNVDITSSSAGNNNFDIGRTTEFARASLGGLIVEIRGSTNTDVTGPIQFSSFGAGAITADAAGVLSSVSDERAKMNIKYYTDGIDAINKFNPISYRYNGITGNETEHTYLGFSAQNIYSVLGEFGTGVTPSGKNKGLLTVQDRAILATLVNGEKDLYKMIMELRAEIETLKRK